MPPLPRGRADRPAPQAPEQTLPLSRESVDGLFREHAVRRLSQGLLGGYVSPLRSLGYDIERNLAEPLAAIPRLLGLDESPVKIGVRTGDTSAYQRRKLRDKPPHLLITTPDSLSPLLSQEPWHDLCGRARHLIVD